MKNRLLVLAGIVALGSSIAAFQASAQQQAPVVGTAAQLEVVKLKDNFYVITSSSPTPRETFSGGNVSVFITEKGVTLVDTKLANWGQALLDKLKTITPKPVTTIINTHTHSDHTGNDDKFGKVEIIAQENTKANMAKLPAFAGDKAQFLPSKTFATTWTQGSGKDEIQLYYFGRAHTNGDAWVVFPSLRVVHAGDIFSGKSVPLIDTSNGGSLLHISDSLKKAHDGIKNVDIVINGHMPSNTTWTDLAEYADFTADLVAYGRAGFKAGKTPEQLAAEWKLPEKYKGYSPQVANMMGGLVGRFQGLQKELQ